MLYCFILLVTSSPAGFAQTYTTLYSFSGPDGQTPSYGSLAIDSNGNLYGTTLFGGTSQDGNVFELTPGGVETVLHSFSGGADGLNPYGGVIIANGALYGTTYYGGTTSGQCQIGCGTVFKLTVGGKETVLHAFAGPTTDGRFPTAGLTRDAAGNLYGTTSLGGAQDQGTVFGLAPSGKEIFYSFNVTPDGSQPWGSLVRDPSGKIYGTTQIGGKNNCSGTGCGAAFEISSAGESVIYSFGNSSTDGTSPTGGLIEDRSGNLYGTALYGGTHHGCGTVFKLSKSTGAWQEEVLYNFAGAPDGCSPRGSLIRDAHGNLYGTTSNDGADGLGTVFRVSPTGQETVLYSFTGGADGGQPNAGLVGDTQGNLYGTTSIGGSQTCFGGCGVVFKLTP